MSRHPPALSQCDLHMCQPQVALTQAFWQPDHAQAPTQDVLDIDSCGRDGQGGAGSIVGLQLSGKSVGHSEA